MTTAGPAAAAAAAEAGDFSVILCGCCHVRVYGTAARTAHYKSDLHRVNLKRKLLSVAPLSAEKFEQLLAVKKAEDAAKEALVNSKRRIGYYCRTCSKKFSSMKALENHNKSRRHIDAEKARPMSEITGTDDERSLVTTEDEASAVEDAIEENVEPESDDSETESMAAANAIPPTSCVFDGREFDTIEENAAHMAHKFGFFIPYVEHLVDLEGLLVYLGQKVGIGHCCVECDRPFQALEAVRRHMIDKQHCHMTDHDDVWVEEYSEFYDFKDNDDDASEGWVEVPEGEIVEGEDVEDVPSNVGSVVGDIRGAKSAFTRFQPTVASRDEDGDHIVEDAKLVVNGKVLGHRSLNRYYKQSYGRRPNEDSMMVRRVMSEYRLLGYKRTNQPTKEVRAAARLHQAQRRRYDLKVGTKNYYTRKSAIKPSMAVFNSGYRP